MPGSRSHGTRRIPRRDPSGGSLPRLAQDIRLTQPASHVNLSSTPLRHHQRKRNLCMQSSDEFEESRRASASALAPASCTLHCLRLRRLRRAAVERLVSPEYNPISFSFSGELCQVLPRPSATVSDSVSSALHRWRRQLDRVVHMRSRLCFVESAAIGVMRKEET